MDSERVYQILEKHLPPAALGYCFRLWQQKPFQLSLRKSRISKVGDFSQHPGKPPRITINQESHPYLFLVTFIHEVAHLAVHQQHGWKVASHGEIWKAAFRELMSPVLHMGIFPPDLLEGLQKHMINPKASSFSDTALTQLLRKHDERQKAVVLLSEIPEGSMFGLHGRWFKKGKLKRTRVLCHEMRTRRNFLVPADAPVDSAQLSLLPPA